MTSINYPDLVRTSPDSQLRLEICSPDNAPFPREPVNAEQSLWGGFQCDFTYTVKRVAIGEVVWEWTPDEHDPLSAPNDAWLSNQGEVIVITRTPFTSSVVIVNPAGKTIREFDVGSELLNGDEREFHWTSAGSHWSQRGNGLLVEVDGRRLWCFRTELDRQIVIDVDLGTLAAFDGKVQQEVEKAQRRWALQILHDAVDDKQLRGNPFGTHDYEVLSAIETALLWCGIDRVAAAIPFLERLESVEVSGGYTSGWPASDGSATDLVNLMIVRLVQFALRRLGVEPAGYAPDWLFHRQDSSADEIADQLDASDELSDRFLPENRIRIPERLVDRTARLQQIRIGMLKRQVADLVGMPDVEYWNPDRGRLWEYDVLGSDDAAYTMSIQWDYNGDHDIETVKEVLRVQPGWENWKSRVHGL